jgi:hypothetical protein
VEPLEQPASLRVEIRGAVVSDVRPKHPPPAVPVEPPATSPPRPLEAPPQPRAAVMPAATTPQAERESGTHVEIGSIEVRLIPPAPAPRRAGRPKPAGPMARPAALPFGLRQI